MNKKILGIGLMLLLGLNVMANSRGYNNYHGQNGSIQGKGYMRGLDLTDAQRTKMDEIHKKYDQQMEKLRNDKLTSQERRDKMTELRDKKHAEMQSILTKEQLDKVGQGNGRMNKRFGGMCNNSVN